MVSSDRVHQQACLMTNLTTGEPTHVDPASVPVLNHLDFLCRVVLPGEATAGSISVIEQRARLGCMPPRARSRSVDVYRVGWRARPAFRS
jgi:hypothetical protein